MEKAPGNADFCKGQFNTTHWSVVITAGHGSDTQAQVALEKLCQTYWYPLYTYVRRKGHSPHDAQDLTQSFFAQFLSNGAIKHADPNRGRFRSFLLTSLQNFLTNEWDRLKAAKRGGKACVISLDEQDAEGRFIHESIADVSPEKAFERRWALTILENALERLRQECAASGKCSQFEHLKPFLGSETAHGEYELPAAKLGVTIENVGVAVHRLRRRYRELVRAEIAETVTSPLEFEEEMRQLFAALS